MIPRRARLRIALSSTLPVLAATVLVLLPLSVAGLLPWSVPPAVLLAQAVQAWLVLHRLGRPTGGS
ncbi:hypothetical protein ACIQWA_31050 [Kitasatospora sp. NPDC098652]|uniref:hypothetical protein n=1 Tax=Kitasatospora sp. NPDC098652 TaxID=3364095 RepID=UPI0037F6FD3D